MQLVFLSRPGETLKLDLCLCIFGVGGLGECIFRTWVQTSQGCFGYVSGYTLCYLFSEQMPWLTSQ